MKKLKRLEIAQLGDVNKAISFIADAAEAAKELTRAMIVDADAYRAEVQQQMQAHAAKTEFRPKVVFRPTKGKNLWSVSFNAEVYRLGALDPLPIDDDDYAFFWTRPSDGMTFQARSMFQALLAVVQDYCNVEHDAIEFRDNVKEIGEAPEPPYISLEPASDKIMTGPGGFPVLDEPPATGPVAPLENTDADEITTTQTDSATQADDDAH